MMHKYCLSVARTKETNLKNLCNLEAFGDSVSKEAQYTRLHPMYLFWSICVLTRFLLATQPATCYLTHTSLSFPPALTTSSRGAPDSETQDRPGRDFLPRAATKNY